MSNRTAAVLLVVCLAVGTAMAQEPGNLGVYYQTKAKPGHEQQYEEGLKKHRDFHTKVGDKFVWSTWQFETGPDTGQYFSGSGGHHWKDFEAQEAIADQDAADVAATIGPHSERTVATYWAFQPGLSRGTQDGKPSKFLSVVFYRVKPEKQGQFRDAIRKVSEAIGKVEPNSTRRARWYVLANGGDGPTYALVQDRNGWDDFAPPEKSIFQVTEEAFGKEDSGKLWSSFTESYWSTNSTILRYRPDLSTAGGM